MPLIDVPSDGEKGAFRYSLGSTGNDKSSQHGESHIDNSELVFSSPKTSSDPTEAFTPPQLSDEWGIGVASTANAGENDFKSPETPPSDPHNPGITALLGETVLQLSAPVYSIAESLKRAAESAPKDPIAIALRAKNGVSQMVESLRARPGFMSAVLETVSGTSHVEKQLTPMEQIMQALAVQSHSRNYVAFPTLDELSSLPSHMKIAAINLAFHVLTAPKVPTETWRSSEVGFDDSVAASDLVRSDFAIAAYNQPPESDTVLQRQVNRRKQYPVSRLLCLRCGDVKAVALISALGHRRRTVAQTTALYLTRRILDKLSIYCRSEAPSKAAKEGPLETKLRELQRRLSRAEKDLFTRNRPRCHTTASVLRGDADMGPSVRFQTQENCTESINTPALSENALASGSVATATATSAFMQSFSRARTRLATTARDVGRPGGGAAWQKLRSALFNPLDGENPQNSHEIPSSPPCCNGKLQNSSDPTNATARAPSKATQLTANVLENVIIDILSATAEDLNAVSLDIGARPTDPMRHLGRSGHFLTEKNGASVSLIIVQETQSLIGIGQLGEAQMILVKKKATGGDRPDYTVVSLSRNHTCSDPQEASRLTIGGAQILKKLVGKGVVQDMDVHDPVSQRSLLSRLSGPTKTLTDGGGGTMRIPRVPESPPDEIGTTRCENFLQENENDNMNGLREANLRGVRPIDSDGLPAAENKMLAMQDAKQSLEISNVTSSRNHKSEGMHHVKNADSANINGNGSNFEYSMETAIYPDGTELHWSRGMGFTSISNAGFSATPDLTTLHLLPASTDHILLLASPALIESFGTETETVKFFMDELKSGCTLEDAAAALIHDSKSFWELTRTDKPGDLYFVALPFWSNEK